MKASTKTKRTASVMDKVAGAIKSTPPRCENCAHFHVVRLEGFDVETVCRRYPPIVILDGRSSAYPLVLEDDTCGEHKPVSAGGAK